MRRLVLLLALVVANLAAACDGEGSGQPAPAPSAPPSASSVPAANSPGPSPSGSSPVALRPCSASDLEASAGYQGATGSLLGGIGFVNRSPTACRLEGIPQVRILDGERKALAVVQVAKHGQEEVRPVALQPGESAWVVIFWTNWCPAGATPGPSAPVAGGIVTFEVTLPEDRGTVLAPARDVAGRPQGDVPPCWAPGTQSELLVGAFEPAASPR